MASVTLPSELYCGGEELLEHNNKYLHVKEPT